MDIKRLKHLVALAEERSFARAAERVHLSQPALSRSIQAAETEYGLRLFDRGTTEVSPTAAGVFVIERAQKVVTAARTLQRDVDLYSDKLVGDLAFGCGPFAAAILLKVLLPELRRAYPGICLRAEIGTPTNLLQRLRAEELDFFVGDTRVLVANDDVEVSPLAISPVGFYVRIGHPLLDGIPVEPTDFLRYGLGSVRLPTFARQSLLELMDLDDDASLPLHVQCDDVPTLVRTVTATDTVLLVVHAAVAEAVAAGQLARLPVKGDPTFFAEMGVVRLRGRSLSPLADAVNSLLQKIGPPLIEMD